MDRFFKGGVYNPSAWTESGLTGFAIDQLCGQRGQASLKPDVELVANEEAFEFDGTSSGLDLGRIINQHKSHDCIREKLVEVICAILNSLCRKKF